MNTPHASWRRQRQWAGCRFQPGAGAQCAQSPIVRRPPEGHPSGSCSSSLGTWRRRCWGSRFWAAQRTPIPRRGALHWSAASAGSQSRNRCGENRGWAFGCHRCAEWRTHLWKDSHLTLSLRTIPDVMRSSAKSQTSMPSSSCFLKWIPQLVNRSIESCAYMSSLQNIPKNPLIQPGWGWREVENSQLTWDWIWSWIARWRQAWETCHPRPWRSSLPGWA